jgi:hypothetical protein
MSELQGLVGLRVLVRLLVVVVVGGVVVVVEGAAAKLCHGGVGVISESVILGWA